MAPAQPDVNCLYCCIGLSGFRLYLLATLHDVLDSTRINGVADCRRHYDTVLNQQYSQKNYTIVLKKYNTFQGLVCMLDT